VVRVFQYGDTQQNFSRPIPVPPEGVLKGPEPRPRVDVDEDLGLTTLPGDGEVPIVGEGQPEVGVTNSTPGDTPVVSEWAHAREPVVVASTPQPTTPTLVLAAATIPTLVYASDTISILISSGPELRRD